MLEHLKQGVYMSRYATAKQDNCYQQMVVVTCVFIVSTNFAVCVCVTEWELMVRERLSKQSLFLSLSLCTLRPWGPPTLHELSLVCVMKESQHCVKNLLML